jgi:hypothetical protein
MAIIRPIGSTVKIALFKKEVTEGTYVAPSQSIHALPGSLNYTPKVIEDASNVGEVFTTNQFKVGKEIAGAFNFNLHPYFAGDVLYYTLGQSDAPTNPPQGLLYIWYTGTDNYVRVRVVGTDLIAETSADGVTYAGDTNFGTAGTLDLTGTGVDTLAELSAVIEGYTGWESQYVGLGTSASSNIAAFANQIIRNNDIDRGALVIPYTVTSAIAKKHYIYSSNSSSDDIPSFSGVMDRTGIANTAIGWAGIKATQTQLKITSKEIISATMNARAKTYETGKTYSASDIPANSKPFIANGNSRVWIDRMPCRFKDLTIDINNNMFMDECIGSDTYQTQGRQNGTVNISGTLNYEVTTTTDRVTQEIETKMINDQTVEILVYVETDTYADAANTVPFSMFIRIPAVKLSTGFASPTGKERIPLPISGVSVKHDYYKHIECYIVNNLLTEY